MRNVIFDMDGVIVDSEPLADQLFKSIIKELGYDVDQKFLDSLRGLTGRVAWQLSKDHLKLPHDIDHLMQGQRAQSFEFWKSVPDFKPNPGVRDLVESLRGRKWKLALASSARRWRIGLFLDRLQFNVFDIVVSGEEVKHSKPAPDIFLLVANKLKAHPHDCIVIEDSKIGVQAAKAAGMKCLGFKGMPHNTQDLSAADVIIKDFAEVTDEMLDSLYESER